ncbi:MAG: polysaccharide deacetylase family protein [Bacteroidetes bacterium]|nr:polysaccharide deacetylase family protein [Bacteroidota bacterium]
MKKLYLYIVVLFLILIPVLFYISKSRTFQFFGTIISEVHTTDKIVALTFDDGPTGYTTGILDTLKAYNVRATFFLTGEEIQANPELAKAIIADGHSIGNHSYSHQRMLLKSSAFIRHEVDATDSLIRFNGFKQTIYFRPPYAKKLFYLPYYLNKTHRTTVTWNIEPDSDNDTPEAMLKDVRQHIKPGSIILLHAMYRNREVTRKALPLIIQWLQAKGYTFVTVNELLGKV